MSPKGAPEKAIFLGKGGEQPYAEQPNVYFSLLYIYVYEQSINAENFRLCKCYAHKRP
jgi:hypothetical protein